MIIKKNNLLKRIIDESRLSQSLDNLPELELSLKNFLESGFVNKQGLFFLKSLVDPDFKPSRITNQYFDKTEMECSINHVHIGDFVQSRDILKQGLQYALELAERLEKIGNFRVILGYSEQDIEDCNVRFHRIRAEEVNWLSDDLNGYIGEGILVIDTNLE